MYSFYLHGKEFVFICLFVFLLSTLEKVVLLLLWLLLLLLLLFLHFSDTFKPLHNIASFMRKVTTVYSLVHPVSLIYVSGSKKRDLMVHVQVKQPLKK